MKKDCVESYIDYCKTRPEYNSFRADYREEYIVELENDKQRLIELLCECHLLLCEHQEIDPVEWNNRRNELIKEIDETVDYEYEG